MPADAAGVEGIDGAVVAWDALGDAVLGVFELLQRREADFSVTVQAGANSASGALGVTYGSPLPQIRRGARAVARSFQPVFMHPAERAGRLVLRSYGVPVTCTRMKRAAAPPMSTLSRTFSVVALLISTVVLAALKESGCPVISAPAVCTS